MNDELIDKAYKISEENGAILKGSVKLSSGVNCLIFAHYCDSTLFYKDFFRISKNVFRVNRIVKKNIKDIKNLVKVRGYKKVWAKGVFSFYGDLRPLAVEAGFGKWGKNGIIENKVYGSDFLISAVFYK